MNHIGKKQVRNRKKFYSFTLKKVYYVCHPYTGISISQSECLTIPKALSFFTFQREENTTLECSENQDCSPCCNTMQYPLPANHCVYGDPAYPLRVHLRTPFRQGVGFTPQMAAYNKSMSEVRVSVEWLFGDIANYFKFLDFKKNLKIELSSVGKLYVVSGLLRNALTCLYGNQTSQFFGLEPPHIQDYFA